MNIYFIFFIISYYIKKTNIILNIMPIFRISLINFWFIEGTIFQCEYFIGHFSWSNERQSRSHHHHFGIQIVNHV